MVLYRLLFLLCVATLVVECWIATYPIDHSKCENITVPLCLDSSMKYNSTRLPNHIGYTNQLAIRKFTEQKELQNLVNTKCSPDLVFFLCATLVPICVNFQQPQSIATPPMVQPCRNLCASVYNDCIASMRTLNFQWPTDLNCSDLPDHATGMCVGPMSFAAPKPKPTTVKLKATCRARGLKKNLNLKHLRRYDYVFRAKRISSNRDKTRVRISVQKFFKPTSKNNARTHVNVRNCRSPLIKLLMNKKMFLVLGSKGNDGVLKISELMEWKSTYSRDIRGYITKNNKRQGNKG